ncbi:MAG: hypothetical protein HFH41_07735 [Lachnospiraceae bacterium]|nr:hypothetical protein [Lachnospiraceae bacterium]
MNQSQELRMTYSGLLSQKDGKKIVRVSFERGKDYAEGIVPTGVIEKSSGFTSEELSQLSSYLKENAGDLLTKAKEVNPLRSWMKQTEKS